MNSSIFNCFCFVKRAFSINYHIHTGYAVIESSFTNEFLTICINLFKFGYFSIVKHALVLNISIKSLIKLVCYEFSVFKIILQIICCSFI